MVAVSLGIRVDLEPMRKPFEAMASETVGRPVKLEGEVFLVPTWSVTVEAHALRIANPEGWERAEFAHVELARLQVELLPLLRRRVVVRELRAEGIEARLERRADGTVNWDFTGDETHEPEPDPEPEMVADAEPEPTSETAGDEPPAWRELLPRAIVIERLALRDIRAEGHDAVAGTQRYLAVERLDGTASTDAPLELSLSGSYDGHSFVHSLRTGDPDLLIGGDAAWPLWSEFEIADTRLELTAQVDEGEWDFAEALRFFLATAHSPFAELEHDRLVAMTLTIEGERLDALDPLFDVSLPPWGPLRLQGHFEVFGGGDFSAEVVTQVGSSKLSGKLEIQARSTPPRFELALNAPTVQLDDFPLQGWSALGAQPAGTTQPGALRQPSAGRALLSPDVMSRLDAQLQVDVAKVASGSDWLGKGRISAHLENGSFRLDAFDIDAPGGSVRTRASLTPGRRSMSGTLEFATDRFDYGILARRFDPDTDMRGVFATKIDLKSTAPDPTRFVEHASGRVDVAVFPEKLEAGVVDLWAVNLAAAVLPAIDSDEQSKVNCLVALMKMKDGIMTEEVLIADTSRMTVHGKARIDFRKNWIDLDLAPDPKRPEFFSAATPIEVHGNLEAFDIDDVLQTLVRFLTSVIHVPIRRLFHHSESPEELDACMAALHGR